MKIENIFNQNSQGFDKEHKVPSSENNKKIVTIVKDAIQADESDPYDLSLEITKKVTNQKNGTADPIMVLSEIEYSVCTCTLGGCDTRGCG